MHDALRAAGLPAAGAARVSVSAVLVLAPGTSGVLIASAALYSATVVTNSSSCSSNWSSSRALFSDDGPNASRRIFAITSLRCATWPSRFCTFCSAAAARPSNSLARASTAISSALSAAISFGSASGSTAMRVFYTASRAPAIGLSRNFWPVRSLWRAPIDAFEHVTQLCGRYRHRAFRWRGPDDMTYSGVCG